MIRSLLILVLAVYVLIQEYRLALVRRDMQTAIQELNDAAFFVPPPPNIPRDEALERLRNPREQ